MKTSLALVFASAALGAACNGSLYSPSRVPRLAESEFLAFGDSITAGVPALCPTGAATMTLQQLMFALPVVAGESWSYPSVLQGELQERYAAQSPTVSNRGVGGELVADGLKRLPGVLIDETPGVLLIVEGANDVNQSVPPSSIAESLRGMIRLARSSGIRSYVGTILPQRPVGILGSCRGFGASRVTAANTEIRSMVGSEGAVLVDLYEAFGGVPGDLIGPDGLHPTMDGYRRIADTFYGSIRQRLED